MTTTVEPPAAVSDVTEDAAPSASARWRAPRLSTVFALVFMAAGLKIGLRQLHDNSFMWHLRTGRLILAHGIPHHDPFSYTANGTAWVAQSWLAELWYGVLDAIRGAYAIRVFDALLGGLTGFLLFRIPYLASRERLRAGALAALAFLVVLNVWSERPLMLGIVAMLLLVYAMELPDSVLGRHPMVTLPVLMWLWANVHGTFMLGFVYVGLHLLGRAWEGHRPTVGRERALLRASVVAGLVTLLNPYGLDLVLFPVRLMGRSQVLNSVSEWQSPNFRELGARFFAAWIVVMIVILARKHAGRRDLLVSVAFVVLGLWAIRNVGLAAIVALPILARLVRVDTPRRDDRKPLHALLAAVLIGAMALSIVQAAGTPAFDLHGYPVAAWKAVQDQHLEGRHLLTTDAWAGYVILDAWPQQHVFFDDRYDMYPLQLNADYMTLLDAKPGWDGVLTKYDAEVVMWPKSSPLVSLLATRSDWHRVFADDTAVVYVKRLATPSSH